MRYSLTKDDQEDQNNYHAGTTTVIPDNANECNIPGKKIITTNIGINGPVNHIFVINPKKLDNFCKNLLKELREAYNKFVVYIGSGNEEDIAKVERGLNISLQLVVDFENYVDDKLIHLNLKE